MKIRLPLFILLCLTVLASCRSGAENQANYYNAPTITQSIATKAEREKYVRNQKTALERSGFNISLGGEESDVLTVETTKTKFEAFTRLRPDFHRLRSLGFKQVVLIGKDGSETVELKDGKI